MTNGYQSPPRLAAAILNRLADRNEALAGDLLEAYRAKPSSLRLWRELIGAVVTGAFRTTGEIRPLKLVDGLPPMMRRIDLKPADAHLHVLGLAVLTASPVHGIGGLGIVATVMLISLLEPALWWIVLTGVAGGVVFGAARVALRRRLPLSPDPHLTSVVLFDHHAR
jgi:hypothetical protein